MTGPYADEAEEDKPLDPAVERVRRKLVRFVAINLGLLLLALMTVVGALVYKARTSSVATPEIGGDIPAPAGGQLTGEIVLPVGAKVVSQSLSGGRITIDAELVDGNRVIYLYDIAERRIVGQFSIRNK
ncbi:MAG: fimbrial protein [Proteobacteria bacterium]|jgi:hypothetical protein|uniref:hypothetical protein n=1 Tax=Hyphomicrobiales TaxID=356 RepID=UPI00037E63C4|nr:MULTISPECIES: hypothetical protein [Phyllobacteriaceae]MCA0275693.1 fimbrial protein [Pseudomonadota bacterium]MCX8567637.1 fimbrial protein [Aminobacter sp. MET-1]